jgi:hypothetical protein
MHLGLLILLAFPALARAGMTHEYYSRGRSPYGSNMYLSQQAHYARTSVLATPGADHRDAGAPATPHEFRGYSLQTAVGFEHFRFLQTGLTYANAHADSVSGGRDAFAGHEFGAEARIVLTSPVANVGLGGGAYVTKKDLARGLEKYALQGQGYKAGLEFTYFCSPRVSLVASASQHVETLSDRSRGTAVGKAQAQSTRLGGGIAIWL